VSKAVKKIASIAAPIVGGMFGGPIGAAAGGALGGAIGGKGLKGALIGGLTGYAGNAIGSSLGSSLSKGIGGTAIGSLTSKNAMGPFSFGNLGSSVANTLGNTVANTTLGQMVGSYAGNSIAQSVGDSFMPMDEDSPKTSAPSPFQPTRSPSVDLPGSLADMQGQDEGQMSSNLATQGVYGGGLGGEEQAYFNSLINRRLIDDSGNVDADLSEVNPIEQSYLAQLGLGGYKDSRSLLEALSKWKAQ
jgi:hypothetical protein